MAGRLGRDGLELGLHKKLSFGNDELDAGLAAGVRGGEDTSLCVFLTKSLRSSVDAPVIQSQGLYSEYLLPQTQKASRQKRHSRTYDMM